VLVNVYIGLGSNLGPGRANLEAAWQRLDESGSLELLELSSPYRAEPVGMATTNWFTNAVGLIETDLAPEPLLALLLRIETAMGRDRGEDTGRPLDRIIDLDLLYYDEVCRRTPLLTVPHPEIQDRLFVLYPLAEVAPEWRHPLLHLTAADMIRRLEETGRARGLVLPRVERLTWRD